VGEIRKGRGSIIIETKETGTAFIIREKGFTSRVTGGGARKMSRSIIRARNIKGREVVHKNRPLRKREKEILMLWKAKQKGRYYVPAKERKKESPGEAVA